MAESPSYPTAVNDNYLGDLSAWVAFDYFLCGDDTEECYAGSTASWDNNEGFDIIFDENPSDELSFYVVAQWDDALDKPLFACPAGEPMTAHHLWKKL